MNLRSLPRVPTNSDSQLRTSGGTRDLCSEVVGILFAEEESCVVVFHELPRRWNVTGHKHSRCGLCLEVHAGLLLVGGRTDHDVGHCQVLGHPSVVHPAGEPEPAVRPVILALLLDLLTTWSVAGHHKDQIGVCWQ